MPNNASPNESSISEEITDIISNYTKRRIELNSEIYYDLKIYGDDLYEIFEKLIEKYHVNYRKIDLSKIAPGEGGGLIGWIACLFRLRPYDSFKVSDLVNYTVQGVVS